MLCYFFDNRRSDGIFEYFSAALNNGRSRNSYFGHNVPDPAGMIGRICMAGRCMIQKREKSGGKFLCKKRFQKFFRENRNFLLHFEKQHDIMKKLQRGRQNKWGRSSRGRALEWHSRGSRFDPDRLHQIKDLITGSGPFLPVKAMILPVRLCCP